MKSVFLRAREVDDAIQDGNVSNEDSLNGNAAKEFAADGNGEGA